VTTLRKIVFEDCYKRHTYAEIRELISADVAARLNPENCYSVVYYGRRRYTNRPVAEQQGEDGQKRYRRAQKIRYRPREEWIAIPVSDIGVPREHLEAARRAVANNRRPSGAGDRFWELSGGVLFCGGCGRRMSPGRRTNSSGSDRIYFYYRCPKRRIEGPGACPNEKTQRAEKVEAGVWEVISGLLADPERLRLGLERMIERERSAVSRAPEREAALWARRLEQLERKRSSFQDMAAEGLITFDELRAKLEILQRDHAQAKAELEAASYRKEKIAALEADAESLLATYATAIPEHIQSLNAEERHRVYELLDLRAVARCDGTVELTAPLGRIGLCVNQTQLHS
jgi:site-specific DNA recombinase